MGNSVLKPCHSGAQGFNAAIHCVLHNDHEALAALFETDSGLGCPDRKGNLLAVMAAKGNIDMMEKYVRRARDVLGAAELPERSARALKLKLQTRFGQFATADAIAGQLLNVTEPMGRSPLYMHKIPLSALLTAAKAGHWEAIKWMMQQGCDIIQPQPISGFTVLHVAAQHGRADLLRLLLQCTHPVESVNGIGPLCQAVFKPLAGGTECSWVNMHAVARVTPLMVASYHGHEDCVKVLLSFGALVHARSVGNNSALLMPGRSTALHCASRMGHTSICKALLQAQVMYMGNAANRQRTRWEGNGRLDVRIMRNTVGAIPYSYARHLHHDEVLTNMLDPSIPLAAVLDNVDVADFMCIGVPTLYFLAASALRRHLHARLAHLSAQLASGGNEAAEAAAPHDALDADNSGAIPIGSPTAHPSAGSSCSLPVRQSIASNEGAAVGVDGLLVQSVSVSSTAGQMHSTDSVAKPEAFIEQHCISGRPTSPSSGSLQGAPSLAPSQHSVFQLPHSVEPVVMFEEPLPRISGSSDDSKRFAVPLVEPKSPSANQGGASPPWWSVSAPVLVDSRAASPPPPFPPPRAPSPAPTVSRRDSSESHAMHSSTLPPVPPRCASARDYRPPPDSAYLKPRASIDGGVNTVLRSGAMPLRQIHHDARRSTVSGASSSGMAFGHSERSPDTFRTYHARTTLPGSYAQMSAPDNALTGAKQLSTANKRLTHAELLDLKKDIAQLALLIESGAGGQKLEGRSRAQSARRLFSYRSNALEVSPEIISSTAPLNRSSFRSTHLTFRSNTLASNLDADPTTNDEDDDDCPSMAGSLDNCCGICLDAKVEVATAPCSHCLCLACAREICNYTSSPAMCPFCRALIKDFSSLSVK